MNSVAVGYLQKIGILRVREAHKIDLAAEEGFEAFLQAEPTIGSAVPIMTQEVYEEIEITSIGIEITACGRAEQFEVFDLIFPAQRGNRRQMLFD